MQQRDQVSQIPESVQEGVNGKVSRCTMDSLNIQIGDLVGCKLTGAVLLVFVIEAQHTTSWFCCHFWEEDTKTWRDFPAYRSKAEIACNISAKGRRGELSPEDTVYYLDILRSAP